MSVNHRKIAEASHRKIAEESHRKIAEASHRKIAKASHRKIAEASLQLSISRRQSWELYRNCKFVIKKITRLSYFL
jgi:hypothetical protein